MKELFNVYRKEWIGLLFLSLVFALSSFWVARAYRACKETLFISHQLSQQLRVAERALRQLKAYDRSSCWRQISPPQKIKLYAKLGLRPLAEVINKLSSLYVAHGFFFLDKFELKTCLNKQSSCVPHLYVTGRKVYYGKI